MLELGFERKGKNFFHKNTELSVEFPSGPIGIGDRVPVKPEGRIKVNGTTVILLSPTQSLMDRLAWFYFKNDLSVAFDLRQYWYSQFEDLRKSLFQHIFFSNAQRNQI